MSVTRHRRRLLGLAYRMLGSLAEAEDVVQDAFLRWHGVRTEDVRDEGAYLSKMVTRLCLDHIKSARVRRETYVGPWLPEPVVDAAALSAESASELANDLSVALILALERLSPLERAAFLLHDVFDVGFPQVADTLGRSEAACRQLAARAREHVAQARPRFAPSPEEGTRLAAAFQLALATGDMAALSHLLAEDVVLHSDGGGKRHAALKPILGRDRVMRFFIGVLTRKRKAPPKALVPTLINGLPGFVVHELDGSCSTLALQIDQGRVVALYAVNNPDKVDRLRLVEG